MVSCPTKQCEQTRGRVFRVIDYSVTLDDRCQRPAAKLSAVSVPKQFYPVPSLSYRNLLDFNETTSWLWENLEDYGRIRGLRVLYFECYWDLVFCMIKLLGRVNSSEISSYLNLLKKL